MSEHRLPDRLRAILVEIIEREEKRIFFGLPTHTPTVFGPEKPRCKCYIIHRSDCPEFCCT